MELALVTATAVVLGVAGTLKVTGDEALRYRALGLAELAIAVGVVLPATRVVGLLAGAALGVCFTGYVLARDRPCRCFGERFRATSRLARLLRAGGVVVLCGAGLAASLEAAPSAGTQWQLTPLVVGAVIGALVIVIPPVLSFEIHDDAEEAGLNV